MSYADELRALTKSEARPDLCQWFALCMNAATKTRSHPILGDVPICERCDTKMEGEGR